MEFIRKCFRLCNHFLLTVKEMIYFLWLLFLYLPHYNYKKYRKSRKKKSDWLMVAFEYCWSIICNANYKNKHGNYCMRKAKATCITHKAKYYFRPTCLKVHVSLVFALISKETVVKFCTLFENCSWLTGDIFLTSNLKH